MQFYSISMQTKWNKLTFLFSGLPAQQPSKHQPIFTSSKSNIHTGHSEVPFCQERQSSKATESLTFEQIVSATLQDMQDTHKTENES